MLKIAIVGPEESKWNKEQIKNVKNNICLIFGRNAKFPNTPFVDTSDADLSEVILVSGHCPKGGVDIWAEEMADNLGIKKEIFAPEVNQWNDKREWYDTYIVDRIGYKTRNEMIAKVCNVLYCIVPKTGYTDCPQIKQYYCNHCKQWGHPSNGGCYTYNVANKLGKETHLIVIK